LNSEAVSGRRMVLAWGGREAHEAGSLPVVFLQIEDWNLNL
jgi:hypothetical protein